MAPMLQGQVLLVYCYAVYLYSNSVIGQVRIVGRNEQGLAYY